MPPRCLPGLTLLWLLASLTAGAAPTDPDFAGEILQYRIRVGFVTAGEATIATRPGDTPDTVEILLTARSSGILSALYPIRDRIASRALRNDYRTLALHRRIREGKRRHHDRWAIDHRRGEAVEQRGTRVTIPAGVHDILSVLWRLRSDRPAPGDTLARAVFLGPETSIMTAVAGPPTDVDVPAGRFTCVPLYPSLHGTPRVDDDADVIVDCARGLRRIPVRIRLRLPVIGRATVELVSNAP